MKQLYLIAFLVFSSFAFGQQSKANADIDGFKLYPNPTTDGRVFIETAAEGPKKILVFDVLGTQVLQTTLLGNELNVSNLDKGVYILRVFENNKVATRKLVVR